MSMNRISVLFYFKKRKQQKHSLPPIYLRVTVGNSRFELSTKRRWDPSRWNHSTGRAIGNREDARTLNVDLDTLQARVTEAERQILADREEVTSRSMQYYLDGKKSKARTLVPIFKHHNDQVAQLVDKDFSAGTLERYETALRHTVSFIQWKYEKPDIEINDLDFEFVSEFEFWLKAHRSCSHNTAVKYISNLKKIVNICLRNGWLLRDPFIGYKLNKREVIRDFLTQDEISKLITKEFSTRRLSIVRDLYVFCCYTGLAYADVKKLKRSEISTGIDGEKWIFTARKKTETKSSIPLLPTALSILQKYENDPLLINKDLVLPVPSNQKMNEYLKEIANLCEISKNMTSHTARHTFATTVTLSNGVPIETVSKMLGHVNLKTTQHYAKIIDSKTSDDMMMLRNKLVARTQIQHLATSTSQPQSPTI